MKNVFEKIRRHPSRMVVGLILGGHFLMLISFYSPAFSTPDANGYFKQAQLIAAHGRTWTKAASPIQYCSIHWMAADGNRIYSRYPPGLPTLMAIPIKLLGTQAGVLVNYILTTLTLLGLFVLCRMWVGDRWAVVAVALMACNPVANTYALTGDSHAAAAFFLIWGIVFLARWSQHMAPGSAFWGGLLLGIVPTIRYPEALFGLGVAFFILFHLKHNQKAWVGAAMALLGASLPIVSLMVHNQIAFGAVYKTAYGITHEQTGFSWHYFSQNAGLYLENILCHGAGILWVFGMVGLGMLCINKKTRKQGVLFVLLVFPITLLYTAYFFMLNDHPYSTIRFLLPTFYIYAIGGVWGLKFIANRYTHVATVMTAALLVVNTLWGVPRSLVSMMIINDADTSLAAVEKVVSEHVQPGSIVIAPAHIQQHLDYFDRWRLMEDCAIEGLPMTMRYIMGSGLDGAQEKDGVSGGYQNFAGGNKENRLLMIISQDIKRKIKMGPYTTSMAGDVPAALYNEIDRWRGHDGEIFWIGKVENMRDKVPPGDTLSVVKSIAPVQPLSAKAKMIFPDQLDRLNDRLWQGLLSRDMFITNPMGILWLIHNDGGLELVKWTRHNGA